MQDARTVARVGLAEQVRQQLLERIMDRDLPPGGRLNVDALAREMGVSTTPLREALSALTARGVVRNEPFLGFTVAPLPDAAFLRDLYAVRMRLEPWLAGFAAARITPDLVGLLEASVSDMGAHAIHGPWQNHRTHALADEAFHDLIAQAAGNTPARQALDALNGQIHASRLYMASQTGAEATAAEHRAILAALIAGDVGGATAAMAAHLAGSLDRLMP